jgi:hypothetical protein
MMPMQLEKSIKVKKKLLEKSYRCNHEHSCKSYNWQSCGSIDESISDMILHIAKPDQEKLMHECNYHLPFGGDHYCTCPARMYIYKNFGV